MALVQTTMMAAFYALTNAKPQNRAELAQKWAQAYDSYASLAQTANGGVAIAAGRQQALQGVLTAVLQTPIGVPAVVATAWGTGLTAYWGGLPFTPGVVPNPPFTLPGVAAPPIAISALIAALTGIYSLTNSSAESFAQSQAAALDACTRTVIVSFGATPQPVT